MKKVFGLFLIFNFLLLGRGSLVTHAQDMGLNNDLNVRVTSLIEEELTFEETMESWEEILNDEGLTSEIVTINDFETIISVSELQTRNVVARVQVTQTVNTPRTEVRWALTPLIGTLDGFVGRSSILDHTLSGVVSVLSGRDHFGTGRTGTLAVPSARNRILAHKLHGSAPMNGGTILLPIVSETPTWVGTH